MSGRSLQVSPSNLNRVKQALTRRNLIQRSLVDEGIASWATINKFFNGKPVARTIFLEICTYLDLDWQEIVADSNLEQPPPPPPQTTPLNSVSLSPPLLEAVMQTSAAAREALTPRILERIPRAIVRDKYLPAIARGLDGQTSRIVAIVAPAGYGKSTILGDLYDELRQTQIAWVGLVLCSTLSLSVGFRSFFSYGLVSATVPGFPPDTTGASTPTPYQTSMLDVALGESFCGQPRSLVEAAQQLVTEQGQGVLLLDTLDLVINREFVPVFNAILRQLLSLGITVVLTCRDHEYNDYLEPTRERLVGVSQWVDRHSVPNFTSTEIHQAAAAFFRRLEGATPEQGENFAKQILALSADNRSLLEIIQNPLLLALLCDLFAKDGTVPPDLTVSKLYRRYWQEKVAYSRLKHQDTNLIAIEKENLCLAIARVLFEHSQERLAESLYRDELGLPFTEPLAKAYDDLISEGVIELLPSRKVHFFHQTLLEYAIAYWLTRHTAQAQRQQLLETFHQPEASLTKSYWLPVLRQLLTIVEDEDEFEQLVAQLDTRDMGIFGVIALASTSRDRPDALQKLLPTALELGEAYQRRLRQALGTASQQLVESTWGMLLSLLEHAEHSTAGNTAQLAGELMSRWWQKLCNRLPDTLAAIAKRTSAVAGQGYQAQGDRSLLFGWLLQPCLPFLQQTPKPSLLLALQHHLPLLGYRTSATVIQLHTHSDVSESLQQTLLKQLIAVPISNHESVEEATCDFLTSLLPHHLNSSSFPLGNSWMDILYSPLPDQWDVVQAKSVGRWAVNDDQVLQGVLQDFLYGAKQQLRRCLITLTETVDQGGAPNVAQCLMKINLQSLETDHYKRLSPLLTRSIKHLTSDTQEQLVQWLKPQAYNQISQLHPVLDALADTSPTARYLLEQGLETLPVDKQVQIRNQLLRFQPIKHHPPLITLDHASQKFLVMFYQKQAGTNPDALERLLEAAQCRIREVALLASTDLMQFCGKNLQPEQVFPLLQSIFPGVRANALLCITELIQQANLLSTEGLTHVCQVLSQENNQAVARQFCQFSTTWVRQTQQVPVAMLNTLAAIPQRLSEQKLFEGGTARALMDALKAISQSESPSLDIELTEKIVRELLNSININQIRNSESEMIDLLSAMNRLNPHFLMQVIREDCPSLSTKGWIRNISVLVKMVRRVENQHSNVLDHILTADWCTPEIRSIILEVRGG